MGVNKDKKLDVSNGYMAQKYTREILPQMSDKDIRLTQELIEEVNGKGYSIQFLYQLSWMDQEDAKILSLIIKKYIGKFDRKVINSSLITRLGVRGNKDVTDFLLEEFRKPNDCEVGVEDWNDSRRAAASNALLQIRDKDKLDEYIEIVKNTNTCDDSYFIITLIGKIKSEKSFQCLTEVLSSPNYELQAYAIRALGNYGEYEGVEELILPFLESDYEVLQESARECLNKVRKKKKKIEAKKKL